MTTDATAQQLIDAAEVALGNPADADDFRRDTQKVVDYLVAQATEVRLTKLWFAASDNRRQLELSPGYLGWLQTVRMYAAPDSRIVRDQFSSSSSSDTDLVIGPEIPEV